MADKKQKKPKVDPFAPVSPDPSSSSSAAAAKSDVYDVGFPVYGAAAVVVPSRISAAAASGSNRQNGKEGKAKKLTLRPLIALVGGGGTSRTGVHNRLSIFELPVAAAQDQVLRLKAQHTLEDGADAPMCLCSLAPSASVSLPSSTTADVGSLVAFGANAPESTNANGTSEDTGNLRVLHVASPSPSLHPGGGAGYGADATTEQTERDGSSTLAKGLELEARARMCTVDVARAKDDQEVYQKVVAMQQRRKDGTLLVASGDTAGLLSLRTVPRTPTAASKELLRVSFDDDDDDDAEKADDKSKSKKPEPAIYDVDFSADGALVGACTEHRLVVFRTTPPRRRTASERKEVEDDDEAADESPVQVIERPVLRKDMTCTFRSAKFGRRATASLLFTVVNASSTTTKGRRTKVERKAFVSCWDTGDDGGGGGGGDGAARDGAEPWKLVRTRQVASKPVTTFCVSRTGDLLAFGAADLSVGILAARGASLALLMRVNKAHEFPCTSLAFIPAQDDEDDDGGEQALVSASADNSVRVTRISSAIQASAARSTSLLDMPLGLDGVAGALLALVSSLILFSDALPPTSSFTMSLVRWGLTILLACASAILGSLFMLGRVAPADSTRVSVICAMLVALVAASIAQLIMVDDDHVTQLATEHIHF